MSSVHLDDEQVQRMLHGELTPEAHATTATHLGACVECRARVAIAEREERGALALLEHLDHAAPTVHVRSVMTARRPRPGLARWAATILLVVAVGGVAYAAPGSPLPRLFDRLLSRRDVSPPERTVTPNTDSSRTDEEVTQGVAVAPGDRFVIDFASRSPTAVAAISLTDDPEIAVRAVGGSATFTSAVDRVSIGSDASVTRFEIEIPRAAPQVEVRVAGRRVFLKEGDRVTADGDRDATGSYRVPLAVKTISAPLRVRMVSDGRPIGRSSLEALKLSFQIEPGG